MTKMKKLVSLVLAALMLVGMMSVASAEDVTTEVNVTVSVTGHTFKAYQVFDADSQDATTGALGNVVWGSGVNGSALLSDLQNSDAFKKNDVNLFASCESAQDVAEVLKDFANDSEEAKAFAKLALANKAGEGTAINAQTTMLPIGYYLIVDTTELGNEADDAMNAALLQVTKDITIGVKTGKPSVEKKVKDTNDSTGANSDWQDSADYDIGDVVPFQLTATLPAKLEYYSTYSITFHDTLSTGLTYEDNTLNVYLNSTENDPLTNTTDYSVSCSDGHNITITVNDVLALGAKSGDKIIVTYGAKLNSNANIGADGNTNTVYLTYSNNPDSTGTGKTPVDEVIVFTYKVIVNKVDGNKAPLTGAGFTLYKQTGVDTESQPVWTAIGNELTGEAMTTFEWTGLDDGNYKLEETTTPDGYNTIDPIEFTISATHATEWTDFNTTALTELTNGNVNTGTVFTANTSTGTLTAEIENKSGATLPETGGIGTTIFYAVGGLLVVLAVVLLVTKRRVGEEN